MNLIQKTAKDHYFVFNERPFSDWGYVLSADNTYNTPSRDVDSISIPGRNGAIHIDHGRWNNIDVTYTCFIEDDFDVKFNDFKRYVSSLRGYQRLEDTFHPGEYREAMLIDGINIDLLGAGYQSGRFNVTFNCKPQRFLKSGEIPVEIPCNPAADPVAVRRYWRFSNFSETLQGEIMSSLTGLYGYTQAEVNAMQFNIITVDDSTLASLRQMGHIQKLLEVKGYNSDRFFAAFTEDDPFTATGYAIRWTDRPVFGTDAFDLSFEKYIIVQKSLGTEIWYDSELIAQDENYQIAEIFNPTRFDAIPQIRIKMPARTYGLEGYTVYLGGINQSGVSLKFDAGMSVQGDDAVVTIDCDTMDTYILPEDNVVYGNFVNLNPNAKIYGNRIVLKPGKNTIRLDPMIAGCEIVPRWWTI